MDDSVPPSHHRTAQADAGPDYSHDDPVVDAALTWFGRLREPRDDEALMAQFRQWLAGDPRHEAEFRRIEAIWGSTALLKAAQSLPAAGTGEPAARPHRVDGGLWRIAAALATVAVLATGIWHAPRLMENWRADYLTATGERTTVDLPDGSVMVLNTDSAVTLDFAGGRRDIAILRGEAWFDVRHDPAHPFRVSGGFGRAVVRGTAFSVRRHDDRDEVVLERGSVDVACLCTGARQVELHPGEAVAILRDGPEAPAPVSTGKALAWREGRIVFGDVRLDQVAAELSRYYDGRILVAGDRIGRLVVTGNYRLDGVEDAIRTLADAAGVKMTRLPGGLIILR